MTQPIPGPDGPQGLAETPPPRVRRPRWQVGLRGMMLFTAACAVWMTYLFNRQYYASLAARIAVMRPLARELFVDDEKQATVVKLNELWMDDNRWDVYLPPGQYRLCLATRKLPGNNGLAPVVASHPLTAGRHALEVVLKKKETTWWVAVNSDGTEVIAAEEPLEWNADRGSGTSGAFSESTTVPATSPIVLHRCTFMRAEANGVSSTPSEASEGILLWIEPATPSY